MLWILWDIYNMNRKYLQRCRTWIYRVLKVLISGIVVMWLTFWYISGSPLGAVKFFFTYYTASQFFMTPVTKDALFTGALKGMMESLNEPHSMYMNREEFHELLSATSGTYSGVGIVLGAAESGGLEAMSVIEDQPADRAGIVSGDKIIKIDGKDITSMPLNEAASLIRGEANTHVTLTVVHNGSMEDIDLIREQIKLPTVKGKMLTPDVGYIRISQFAEDTGKDFARTYEELQKQGMKKLVLDLRNNPGGLLNVAQEVSNYIIPKGILVTVQSRTGTIDYYESEGVEPSIPMAVLINKGSASASEIIAGAVQDRQVGTIVGTTSYGKGTVQTVLPSVGGEGIKVTIAKYHTPNDRVIDGIGIEPDVEFPLPEGERPSYKDVLDSQIQKCLEILDKKY